MNEAENTLRNILDSNGLGQTELAIESKVSLGTINKLCNNHISVTLKTKNRLLIGLNKLSGKHLTIDEVFPPE